jgi:PPOX class probable F420-dependent enzyme
MDIEAARQFVREHHRAVLATRRADGRPQLSPVLVGVDAAGRAMISTRETALKTRNMRRDPQVSLCVMSDGFFGPWVQIEGLATLLSLPEALEELVDYYRRVAGEHPHWDEYRQAMEKEQRVLVRITIDRAGPDRSG